MWCSERTLPRRTLAAFVALAVFAALALAFGGQAHAQGAPDGPRLALVAARTTGLEALTRESAEQFYLGRRTALPDGRAVTLVDLPAGPTRDQFYLRLARKNPSQIRAYWSRLVFTGRAQPPIEAANAEEVRRLLRSIQGAIAYLPLEEAQDPDLVVLLTLD